VSWLAGMACLVCGGMAEWAEWDGMTSWCGRRRECSSVRLMAFCDTFLG
jgi:hypothetical protein